MKRLLIVGAGGHGRVICDIASLIHRYSRIEFLDDRFGAIKDPFPDTPVIGKINDAAALNEENTEFIVAIGDNNTRESITRQLEAVGVTFATLIHPSAIIGRDVRIGKGTVVMAGSVIQTGTRIGEGCILNTTSSVDHDGMIDDFCHISVGAHLCGAVTVGKGTFVCAGSTIINNISICGGTILGAGSVTVKDITKPGTYVGVPARKMKERL